MRWLQAVLGWLVTSGARWLRRASRLSEAKTWLAPNRRLSVYQFMHLAPAHAEKNQTDDPVAK